MEGYPNDGVEQDHSRRVNELFKFVLIFLAVLALATSGCTEKQEFAPAK